MGKPFTNKGRRNTPESFWLKVDKRGPEECWPWLLARAKNGYGWHSENGATTHAHRRAYELVHGSRGTGIVMHSCNNKICCNPAHLVLGTASQNVSDAFRDGLAASGERHYNAKYPASTIKLIREDTRPTKDVARSYGISRGYINKIRAGQARKHEAANG